MSTTKTSEREKLLETQVGDLTAERDDYKSRYESAREAHNDYQAKYEQAVAERYATQNAVPLFDDPYEALSEEGFATVLEIVLGIAHNRGIVTTPEQVEATTEAESTEEPSEAEYLKALLRRNGLQKAWLLPTGACFSEDHAREYAGAEFDSLTVVTVE